MSSTKEKVGFIQRHEPALKDGQYTIEVTQNVSLLGKEVDHQVEPLFATKSKTIYVAGERYVIDSKNIFQQFPPPNSTGEYSNVLPHISLTRSTLPWERNSRHTTEKDPPVQTTPWMFLFIYDDDDLAQGNVIKPASVPLDKIFVEWSKANNSTKNKSIPLNPEPGDWNQGQDGFTGEKSAEVIKVSTSWLNENDIFPDKEALKLMTSVRSNKVDGEVTSEHAICMANRMPRQGVKSYACLLSLEGRLTNVSQKPDGNTPAYTNQGVSNGYTSFVCLAQWSFTCLSTQSYQINQKTLVNLHKAFPSLETDFEELSLPGLFTNVIAFENAIKKAFNGSPPSDYTSNQDKVLACFKVPDHTFQWYLQNLSSAAIGGDLHISSVSNPTIINYLSKGAIPFPHHLDNGEQTISWYHGPLQSNHDQSNEHPNTHDTGTVKDNPYNAVQASDQLLRFDTALNMLDVSYAAAWELGRLLTLKNKSVAMDLYTWKRQKKWEANQANSNASKILGHETSQNSETKEYNAIQAWSQELIQLKSIPFNYLVPDENMLPKESIRFFSLDNLWIKCLLDGAMSIGRISEADAANDEQFLADFQPTNDFTGFLLHSEVVSGWPSFEVTAKDKAHTTLNLFAKRRLGPNIMLFVFDGGTQIESLDIHLKPESMHFGFDVTYAGETPAYSKQARFQFPLSKPYGSLESPKTVEITWAAQSYKVVDIVTMSKDLKSKSGSTGDFTSAQFVMEMIEGAPNVKFKNGPGSFTPLADMSDDDVLGDDQTNIFEKIGDDIRTEVEKVEDKVEEEVEKVVDEVRTEVEKIKSDIKDVVEDAENDVKDVWDDIEDLFEPEKDKSDLSDSDNRETIGEAQPKKQKEHKPAKHISPWLIVAMALFGAAALYWILSTFVF